MEKNPTLEDIRQYQTRIITIEKLVVMPIKVAVILACFIAIWSILWAPTVAEPDETTLKLDLFKWSLILYAGANIIFWISLFIFGRRIQKVYFIKMIAFFLVIIDNLFLCFLLFLTDDPLSSSIFWVICGLIIRNIVLFPEIKTLLVLSFIFCIFYVGAIILDTLLFKAFASTTETIDYQTILSLVSKNWNYLILRVVILILVTTSCWGIYNLLQQRLRIMDEDRERTIRIERLNLAGLIASGIAHELKNPLAIMNNALFMLKKQSNELNPGLQRQINIIQKEIGRSDKIVTELLDYSRLAEGKIESVDVNSVIDESLSSLRQEVNSRNIVVAKSYSSNLPTLFIDTSQLQKVFSNIILNACEAIDNFGKIRIKTEYTMDGYIKVQIQDTGKGISDDVLPRIFESFFTTKEKGTGLGLSIVNNIVQAYSGKIDVKTNVGKGTTFTLRLPTRTTGTKKWGRDIWLEKKSS